MSLRQRTILITRRRDQAADMAAEIERRGGTPLFFPTITLGPPDSWAACDEALRRLPSYDGIIFTSSNGVEGFFARMNGQNVARSVIEGCRLFAVGEATAAAIARRGVTVYGKPAAFSAEALAREIAREGLSRKRFLLPCGNMPREELPTILRQQGREVDMVPVYATLLPPPDDVTRIRMLILDKTVDTVTFASPSAVRNFATLMEGLTLADVGALSTLAVIGPTTRSALQEYGVDADILATESTARGLVDAVDHYWTTHE